MTTKNQLIYAIIQAITELLPISSSGHLLIASQYLREPVDQSYLSYLHFWTGLALLTYYSPKILNYCKTKEGRTLLIKIILATIPPALIAAAFAGKIEEIFYKQWIIAAALVFWGVVMLIVVQHRKNISRILNVLMNQKTQSGLSSACDSSTCSSGLASSSNSTSSSSSTDYNQDEKPPVKSDNNKILTSQNADDRKIVESSTADTKSANSSITNTSLKELLLIGTSQVLALIPGTSRSGVTMISASLLGLDWEVVLDIVFLLGIPITLGAFAKDLVFNFSDVVIFFSPSFLLSGLVCFVCCLGVVTTVNKVKNNHLLSAFGIYRIFMAFAIILV